VQRLGVELAVRRPQGVVYPMRFGRNEWIIALLAATLLVVCIVGWAMLPDIYAGISPAIVMASPTP